MYECIIVLSALKPFKKCLNLTCKQMILMATEAPSELFTGVHTVGIAFHHKTIAIVDCPSLYKLSFTTKRWLELEHSKLGSEETSEKRQVLSEVVALLTTHGI